MKFIRRFLAQLPVFLMLAVAILSSCKKDPYSIGIDLLPPSDTLNIRITDTTTIVAYSTLQDSIRTDKATTGILGSLMDPVFGKTTASIYSQFRLSAEGASFGTNPVLDSLILVLSYAGSYGDISTTQNVKVYEISEDLQYDSTYYSNKHLRTFSNVLANLSFKPRPTDSLTLNGVKVGPELRINLNHFSNWLGNKILNAPVSALATSQSFISFMKGLNIETTPVYSGGALLSFNISNSASGLVIYYHNNEGDSLHYLMPINVQCSYFTRFDHNQYMDAGQDLKNQVLHHDTTLGKNKLFVQGLGGVWTKIRFPYIKNFGKGHPIAIHNALLIVKNYETDTTLNPPPQLTLIKRDSLGRIATLIDANEGAGYLGGTYDKTRRTYSFRITRHLQQIILGSAYNYDLYLMVNTPTANVLTPNRIVLNGTKPSLPGVYSDRIQLQIIYTRLDQP